MARVQSVADRKIVEEARKRLLRCKDWEAEARSRYLADVKFAEGDSDNNWQWPDNIYQARTSDLNAQQPCLTINKTRQHILQILNDARQNKASIEIRPTGEGATYESAKAFESVVRHIEYQSKSTEAYEAASAHQIQGGFGYWRVVTEYAGPDTFDQDIFIRRVANPLTVYLDPDIAEFDGSDARFGFVVKDMPRDGFEAEHPEWNEMLSEDPLDTDGSAWNDKNYVRIAEYYRKSAKADKLLVIAGQVLKKSEILPEQYAQFRDEGKIERERDVLLDDVEWFKIVGGRIADRKPWAGKYIPLIRVIGEETVIDGKLDRKGHTRALKDAQRMYNYNSSAAVEFGALQSKTPYVAAARAIEGLETYWNKANTDNFAVLPYNDIDDEGSPIARPERQQPPVASTLFMNGMQTASQEMMMVSGQYQAELGAPSNERSGVAIQQRQRQGDNATYHFIDHLAQAIRFTGVILVDLIPKIYDTERVVQIIAEDGTQSDIKIDPQAEKSAMQTIDGRPADPGMIKQAQEDENLRSKVMTIFNPNVGKYGVEADIGPAYATRRQEAFAALSQLMQQNHDLAKIAGDLLFRAADFPMADEIAERIKRSIPANILGSGPPPEVAQMQQAMQQLQQQNAQLKGIIEQMTKALNDKGQDGQAKAQAEQGKAEIAEYDAETRRLATMMKAYPEAFKPVIAGLLTDMMGTHILPAMADHAAVEQAIMPPPVTPALAQVGPGSPPAQASQL